MNLNVDSTHIIGVNCILLLWLKEDKWISCYVSVCAIFVPQQRQAIVSLIFCCFFFFHFPIYSKKCYFRKEIKNFWWIHCFYIPGICRILNPSFMEFFYCLVMSNPSNFWGCEWRMSCHMHVWSQSQYNSWDMTVEGKVNQTWLFYQYFCKIKLYFICA